MSINPNFNLKGLKLAALLLISPLYLFAQQQTLTGLWVGALSNDSTTVRQDQSFEIALTEYRGKVYGYSRSEFIVNDTLYYIVKRVKGTIVGDVCEVKDDEIISFNFPGKRDKGVKLVSTFLRDKKDSTWYLSGTWKTSQTKKYYSVTGRVELMEEKDLSASKIFPHLEELNLAKDVAFYKDRKAIPVVMKTAETENKKLSSFFRTEQLSTIKDETTATNPDISVEVKTVPVSSTQIIRTNTEPSRVGVIGVPVQTDVDLVRAEPKDDIKRQKTSIKTEEVTVNQPNRVSGNPNTKIIEIAKSPVVSKPVITTTTKTDAVLVKAEPVAEKIKPSAELTIPAFTAGRKSEFAQTVTFKSDSLMLALYDNGEIDGDTVSIFFNGEVLLAKQGLKASAIRKTIYISPGKNEEFTLVMFAENLGKYPPNTGLLVVHDGDDVYNIRFSADFQKNAGVVFRKKK